MKLLFILHTFPYPLNEGIKVPVYNLIKEFSKFYELHLLSFVLPQEKKYIEEIKKFCVKVDTIEFIPSKSFVKRVLNTFFSKSPYNVKQFFSIEMKNKILELVNKQNFDILFFDFFTTAIYGSFVKLPIPKLFHYHDAVSMCFYRNSLVEKNLTKKFYWYKQYKKVLNFEKKLPVWFDKITVVAKKDKDWLVENANIEPKNIEVIPNGVDIEYFKFCTEELRIKNKEKLSIKSPSIIFRGIINFQPNVDACIWFLENIFPILKNKIKNIKFYIVGPEPTKNILKYKSDDVIITGYVENLKEFMSACDINVCPMISGSGIKNKILESLAIGIPTVATSIAAEGVPELKDGENVLIADTPAEFVEKIELLLTNKELYKKIADNGRKLIEENYTWEKQAKKFLDVFEEIKENYKTKKISIIVPAYNEEKTIGNVLNTLNTVDFGLKKEIIVVDDGSIDNTRVIIEKFKNNNLKIVSHKTNQGKGAAIKTGIQNSTGDIIVIQDADLEYNPQELKNLIQPIIDKKNSVVYGSRFLKENPCIYKSYYLGNILISSLISFLFKQKVTDSYTCYKVFHKTVFKDIEIKSKRFEFEAEITCKLLKNKYKILELPISYNPRSIQQGKKIKFKDAIIGILTILKIKFFN
jgi:glycosyltransferase involved in cell wall biosynthesis